MWEAISNIAQSQGLIPVLVFIIVLIIVFMIAVKKGVIKFKGKGLEVGIADRERNIINTQLDAVESFVMTFYKTNGYKSDDWKSLYIMSEVEDLIYRWVSINHINTSDTYITLKQDAVWKIICTYSDKIDEDLHEKVNASVKDLIKKLVEIRKYLSN